MKTTCDVKAKLAQLVQGNIATSGQDSFTSCNSSNDSLVVVARDSDGAERSFAITVQETGNCNTKTAAVADADSCCKSPGQPCAEELSEAPAS